MKIRVLSDLHLDLNAHYPLTDKETFTVLCGDISANTEQTIKWIDENIKNGVFVEGNHIGYDSLHSVQYIENLLANTFPLEANVSYLKNSYKIIDDIVFVGGILWTNFELYGMANISYCSFSAKQNMNDYKYNYFNSGDINEENFKQLQKHSLIRRLLPMDTLAMFNETFAKIKEICETYPNKKIVVVTHHAPSMKSISPEFKNDPTSAAFASPLENFILDHPNIKLWCHGHIHSASDYEIGDCRVICNPLGYNFAGEKTGFERNLIVEI